MFNRNKEPQYNQQKLNRAITSGGLRVIVAGYIIFIAINIINGTKTEASTIPAWVGSLIGYVFIAASAGFIIYAVRSFLKALKGARLDADADADAQDDKKTKPEEKKPEAAPEMSIAEKVRAAQAMIPSEKKNGTDQ